MRYSLFIFLCVFLTYLSCRPNTPQHPLDTAYPTIQVDTLQIAIEQSINESSGLISVNNSIWTHNDSGGDPALYKIDPVSGKQLSKLTIDNATNKDWEEVTTDSAYIYVGDFGNNIGQRKDLTIYKILKSEIDSTSTQAEVITFNYPEQNTFPGNYNHNFDCEAFITYGDSIYLFTKNWGDGQCSIYALPKTAGDYDARLISRMDTEGVITGASVNEHNENIALLGYNLEDNHFFPFVWKLSGYTGTDFFNGKKERYNLDIIRQAEAILWTSENRCMVSAENEKSGAASLYSIQL